MAELPEDPTNGEGLLATWGRRLLAALRSMRIRVGPGLEMRQDSEGTTILLAKPPANSGAERPFRARFMRVPGTEGAGTQTGLFVYLPPSTATAVRFRGSVVPCSQALGTAAAPWVRKDPGSGGKLFIEITLARSTGTGASGELEPIGWTLATSDAAASETKWYHLVCAVDSDIGIVQHHLGSLLLGAVDDGEDGCAPSITLNATMGSGTGAVSVPVTRDTGSTDCAPSYTIAFPDLHGADGCSPVITVTASVDGTSGTPGVAVTKGGTDCAPSFAFAFTGLKGAPGSDASLSGTFLTGIASFAISGSNLTITFNTITYPAGTTGTVSKSVPVTSC